MLGPVALAFAMWLAGLGAAGAQDAASTETWPERPVRIIVPYPAGGGGDGVARVVAQKLGAIFRQHVVVENRPGASGMVGTAAVAKAVPDGYTLLVASPVEVSLAPNLFKTMSYDPFTELAPVSLLAWTPLVIAAHPSFPASHPAEFLALIRTETTDYAHPGIGSTHQITGEYINKLAAGRLVGIPYHGAAPALTDVLTGRVKLTITGLPPAVPYLQAGWLKGLAVTSGTRSPLFPDLPALAETKGLEAVDTTNWFGLLAPAGTPPAIVSKLHHAVVQALGDERVREVLRKQAAEPVGNSPAEFGRFIRAESARYAKILEFTGVGAD